MESRVFDHLGGEASSGPTTLKDWNSNLGTFDLITDQWTRADLKYMTFGSYTMVCQLFLSAHRLFRLSIEVFRDKRSTEDQSAVYDLLDNMPSTWQSPEPPVEHPLTT